MSEEPLYCRGCGNEYCECGHTLEAPGRYCELCGRIDCDDPECVQFGGGSDPAEECERWAAGVRDG